MTIFRGPATPYGCRTLRRAGALALLLTLTGCALFYRDPTVTIADVRVVSVGFTGGTAEVLLDVENPNRFALEVRAFQYRLEVRDGPERWTELAVGESEERITLPRRSEERVSLLIPFRMQGVGTALLSWLESGEIGYRMEGRIRARGGVGEVNLPFRARGTLTP